MARIKDFGHSNEDLIIELSKLENIKESEKDVVYSGIDLINEFDNTRDKDIELLSTGFNCDKQNILFERGDLIIIGARPAMGKTAYALNMFYNKIMIFVTLKSVLYLVPNILNIVYGRSNSSFLLWVTKSVQVLQDIIQNIRAIIKELNIPEFENNTGNITKEDPH